MLDARFDIRGADVTRAAGIVIVGIDEDSVGNLPRWPFSRIYHAKVIKRLHDAGARLIAYDVAFDRPTPADAALLRVARGAKPVVFASALIRRGGHIPVLGGPTKLAAYGASAGLALFPIDSDGGIRRTSLSAEGLPTFPAAVAAELRGPASVQKLPRDGLIDYAGPPGTVPQLSFLDVLDQRFDPDAVHDKVVVVGQTATNFQDVHLTSAGPLMTGPEVQANAVSTVLRDFPLQRASDLVRTLCVILLGLVVPLVALRFGSLVCVAAAVAATIAWLAVAQAAFNGGSVLDVVAPLMALALGTAGTVIVAAVAERRERQSLRAMFAADAPDVVDRVLTDDARAPIAPSAIVAGYRIEEPIGRGGMGVVYRATQLALERQVALKLITPDRAAEPDFRARFRRESLTAAAIEHPNVIPVYEAGDDEGLLYIAMRLVDGVDLGQVIRNGGPLSLERSSNIIEQIAGGLDAAHTRGLVHRDVKPANVLLTSDEPPHAYLTDFGLARHIAGRTALTSSDAVVGTLDYIAPEQLLGKPVDRRADVYALAGVLYFCLAGQPPYPADNDAAKMYAHVETDPPKPSLGRPDLPVALDDVVATGLAKDPNARPDTAGALARLVAMSIKGDADGNVPPPAPGYDAEPDGPPATAKRQRRRA
jgi:serine/threonine-protein kinase